MVLDEHTLKFSTMALPDYMKMNFNAENFRVVSGEDGTARIVRVTGSGDLQVFNQLYGSFPGDWVMENRVCLEETNWGLPGHKEEYFTKPAKIIREGDGFIVLSLEQKKKKKKLVFTVDLDTMELKLEHKRDRSTTGPAFPAMPPWPPVLLDRTEKGRKRRKRKGISTLTKYLQTKRADAKTRARSPRSGRGTGNHQGPHGLTDDLLEVILVGLDSPVCLVRAASTCKRWCRVVSDTAAFIRRFRSHHPPRAIGHFYNVSDDLPCSFGQFHIWPKAPPVYVPTSASTAAGIKNLSIDFIPFVGGPPPEIVDSRGSFLLLLKEVHRELEPVDGKSGRYKQIDPPEKCVCILSAFLLDSSDEDEGGNIIGMTDFRVLLEFHHDYGETSYNGHGFMSASVFTSGSGYESDVYLPRLDQVHLAGRTGGCIYWACDNKRVVALD
ncbi:hypothetical protein PR202_gb22843 [Eleusine coracana subsp. coracana]|uniref:F-box domain-containing protein n=1 Tax=Eleusine coracana subsp. coracana TaxID=191504 RepID=A0AAV5FER5_ELECO|nr:hypothetical protein PR202_gb22843 [Eleusine coracana subsp. coracana]